MAKLTLSEFQKLTETFSQEEALNFVSGVDMDKLSRFSRGELDSLEVPDENFARVDAIRSGNADPDLLVSFVDDTGATVLGTPTEKSFRALTELAPVGDNVYKGIQIGLRKGEQAQQAAANLGADLNDPNVQAGIGLAKTLKFAGELAFGAAIAEVTGGVGPLFNFASKAVNTSRAARIASGASSLASDVASGALIGGGANVAANTVGSLASAALPGDSFQSANEVQSELGSIAGEGALSAAMGGAVNAVAAPAMRKFANQAAGRELVDSTDALVTEEGVVLGAKASQVDEKSLDVLNKIAKARYDELAPIKAQLDQAEKVLNSSVKQIPISEFDQKLIQLFEGVGKKPGTKSISGNNLVKSVKDLFGLTKGGAKNIPDPVTGKVANSNTIGEENLNLLRKNLEGIIEKGTTGEMPELRELASQLIQLDAVGGVVEKYPSFLKHAKDAYKAAVVKYGDPKLKGFKSLNDAYSTFKPGSGVAVDGAVARDLLTDSTSSSRAVNKKIGEFVDGGILSPQDVQDVFVGKFARDSLSRNARSSLDTGSSDRARKILKKRGVSPQEEIDLLSGELLSSNTFGSGRPIARQSVTETIPDAVNFSERILKPDAQDALRASLGKTGASFASDIVDNAKKVGFLKKLSPRLQQEADLASKVGVISESRVNPNFAGSDAASNKMSTQAMYNNLNQQKLFGAFGAPVTREVVQDIGTGFDIPTGPLSIPASLMRNGYNSLTNIFGGGTR